MANELQPLSRPYANRGLMLKTDPSLIKDDQYSELTNLVSTQEGNLTTRGGNRRISYGLGVIDTITKLRISEATQSDRYYACEAGNIWSANGPIPAPGAALPFAMIASEVSKGTTFAASRIASADFASGSTGSPMKFFGGNAKMVKDNGALNTAQNWGLLPPPVPATAALDRSAVLPGFDLVAANGSNTRLFGPPTVVQAFGTAPGLFTINPSSNFGISVGMLLTIGSAIGFVATISDFNFTIYLESQPNVGDAITSGIIPTVAPGDFPILSADIDASFDGDATTGFVTEDPVHISISISDPTQLSDLRLRVLVNGSSIDYYEKSILQSALQNQISLKQTATTNLQTATNQIAQGILGGFAITDPTVNTGKPATLNPNAPDSFVNASWTELDIPKSQFTAVGKAGQIGFYNWKHVTGFQIVYTAVSGASPSIAISSVYISGGYGLNGHSTSLTTPLNPYRYVYTYRNPVTGVEGNPSQEMIQTGWVQPKRQRVAVQCWSSLDPQVTGPTSIAVYRAGGAFADNFYRFVGYVANRSLADQLSNNNFATFYDEQSDETIASNDIAEFDNDAPVTSTLPVPATMSFVEWDESFTGLPGFNEFKVNVVSGPDQDISKFLRIGSKVHVAQNSAKAEDCYIYAIGDDGPNTIVLYFQYDHSDFLNNGSVVLECDAVANQPCNLALSAFDSVFLAGDENNPHVLYKSKTGRPESFPVINLETNTANQINVGSPSNPIMNFCEYAGGVLCMNYRGLFLVGIASGVMGTPQETQSQRGLVSKNAWCIADNEVWFLGYDGLYSWSGGQSIWRSEAIDPLFRGKKIGNYLPIDLTRGTGTAGLDIIEMAYMNNEVFMTYTDTAGTPMRLRYHTKFDRFSIEAIYDILNGGTTSTAVTAVFEDQDFGQLLIAKSFNSGLGFNTGFVYLDNAGTSDGWFSVASDGAAIQYAAKPGAIIGQSSTLDKLFSDFILEAANDTSAITLNAFYNFSSIADPTDAFTVPAPGSAQGRRLNPFQLHAGEGFQAHAMELRASGSSAFGVTLYSLAINFIPQAQVSAGRAFDYDNLGYPCDKVFRALDIEIDTGGVQGTIQPWGDGAALGPLLTLTTTATDRRRVISMWSGPGIGQNDLIAKSIKMVLTPGSGGKMEYYNHNWDFVKEPCPQTYWDSFEFTFGYNGYSFIKQLWLEYMCLSPITISFYVDGGVLFGSWNLPAHPKRDVERLYLPAYTGVAPAVLNKSKRHRFTLLTMNSLNAFKVYQDSSRLEWLPCGSDQRAAYQQSPISSLMGPSI